MASPAARCLGLRMFASKAFRRTRRTSSVALPRRMRRALFNSGRSSTSKSRRATFGGCHATETRRHRDKKRGGAEEKGGQGDKEKGRRGSAETRRFEFSFSLSSSLLAPSSPCLLVSLSPCLLVSVALWLCGWSDEFFRETGDIFDARDVRFRHRRGAVQPHLCELVQRGHRPEGRSGLATDRMRGADRGGERSARLRCSQRQLAGRT